MLMLGVMGWQLELVLGKLKFLLLYFAAGLCGNLLSAFAEIRTGGVRGERRGVRRHFRDHRALLYIALRNHGRIGTVSGQWGSCS